MTCYLWDINKFLRDHTLCKSILKCGLPTKGIKLTWVVLFEILGLPQLWGIWFKNLQNARNTSEAMEYEILACLIRWWGLVFVFIIGYFPFLDVISPFEWKYLGSQGSLYLLREEVIFCWCSRGLSLIQRNLK